MDKELTLIFLILLVYISMISIEYDILIYQDEIISYINMILLLGDVIKYNTQQETKTKSRTSRKPDSQMLKIVVIKTTKMLTDNPFSERI